jgi:hypothetical protein
MKKIFILAIGILLSSCLIRKVGGVKYFVAKPNQNSLRKISNLRLNGVYIRLIDSTAFKKRYDVVIPYSNGVALSYYFFINNPQNEITSSMMIDSLNHYIKLDYKYLRGKKIAGGFTVNEKLLKYQLYEIGHYGIYELWDFNGQIINDTTINITSLYINGKNEKNNLKNNFTLHFLQMPKPDSTNQWMQKEWYWVNEK